MMLPETLQNSMSSVSASKWSHVLEKRKSINASWQNEFLGAKEASTVFIYHKSNYFAKKLLYIVLMRQIVVIQRYRCHRKISKRS